MVLFDCIFFLRTGYRFGMDSGVDCFHSGSMHRYTDTYSNAYTDTNPDADTNPNTDDALLRTCLYNRQGLCNWFDRVLQRCCLSGFG
jgi:hypothetical protein